MGANEEDRFAIYDRFYPFSIAIIGEVGVRRIVFLHFHQAAFGIVNQSEGVAANVAHGLVAVGVMGVGIVNADFWSILEINCEISGYRLLRRIDNMPSP